MGWMGRGGDVQRERMDGRGGVCCLFVLLRARPKDVKYMYLGTTYDVHPQKRYRLAT